MKRGWCVTAVMLAIVMTISSGKLWADTPPTAPYDGSGSQHRVKPGDKPYDVKAARQMQAKDAERQQRLQRSIDGGDSGALAKLAAILEQGDDADHHPDRAAALDLYEKAASHKDRVGLEKMCVAYLLGEGRPVDYQKGLTDCYALDAKDAAYTFASAVDYEHGLTGPRDDDAALAFYVEAAKAGSGDAADVIGRRVMAQGKPDAARAWFRQGVYLGSADAMQHLAALVEAGQGGQADAAEAYWLYVNAARRGNVNAAAWVAAAPSSSLPLDRTTLRSSRGVTHLTNNYVDKAGKAQMQPLDIDSLSDMLQGRFPSSALEHGVDGGATIFCYVDANHKVDACIIEREYPLGFDFGRVLEQIFDGHLTIAPVDAEGAPTAGTVFGLTLNWQMR